MQKLITPIFDRQFNYSSTLCTKLGTNGSHFADCLFRLSAHTVRHTRTPVWTHLPTSAGADLGANRRTAKKSNIHIEAN